MHYSTPKMHYPICRQVSRCKTGFRGIRCAFPCNRYGDHESTGEKELRTNCSNRLKKIQKSYLLLLHPAQCKGWAQGRQPGQCEAGLAAGWEVGEEVSAVTAWRFPAHSPQTPHPLSLQTPPPRRRGYEGAWSCRCRSLSLRRALEGGIAGLA